MAGLSLSAGLGLVRLRNRGGPRYDTSAKAIFTFWEANGAPPWGSVKALVNETVVAFKDFGLWGEPDLLGFTAATNLIHALTDSKNPEASKVFSLINSPAYTDRYGITGNGTNSKLGTWLYPATNGVRWTVNDAGVWSYSDTDLATSVPDAGAGETYAAYCIPRSAANQMGGLLNRVSGAPIAAAIASSAGLTGIQRIDANTERLWKDDALQATSTIAAAGYPTGQFQICGRSPSASSTRRVGFAMAGASCLDREAALNSIVMDYITRIRTVS